MIEKAISIANTFGPNEIRDNIIKSTENSIQRIRIEFFKDVNSIMNRFEEILVDVDCSATGLLDNTINRIKESIPNWSFIMKGDQCAAVARYNPPLVMWISNMTRYEIYRYTRCKLENRLTGNTPIDQVVGAYASLQNDVAIIRCATRFSGASNDLWTEEYLDLGFRYSVWSAFR